MGDNAVRIKTLEGTVPYSRQWVVRYSSRTPSGRALALTSLLLGHHRGFLKQR
jgi:hypothetical protein